LFLKVFNDVRKVLMPLLKTHGSLESPETAAEQDSVLFCREQLAV
jgi:hypothetical protein